MKSCIRMLIRRICLRKGLFSVVLVLYVVGFMGIYYFLNHTDEQNLEIEQSGPRNVKVPSLSVSVQPVNVSVGPPHAQDQVTEYSPTVEPSARLMPSIMHNGTPECLFSAAQLATNQFDVQMSAVLDSLSFDNSNGGVWKQGFELDYSMTSFSADSPLQVFIMPHSHNDPGWLKTIEDYFRRQTKNILNLMTDALSKDERKKFVWAEISYLDMWWRDLGDAKKQQFTRLVSNGQLEIVTGGWVMNDEANTHYFAMLDQLMEGHLWLQENLPGVAPQTSWANDPFGYSPTMAYLLQGCGLDSMLIQRAHYEIKKHFAMKKQLEFVWLQEWDRTLDTGILCHLMPFYSYDVPHTCGPDPKICCQFDFNRLPGSKVNCPWKIRPQAITEKNIQERATVLADQYRKKSTIYKTNVLLVPLGDDFRWDTDKEIKNQFENYFKLIDYMNSHPEMKIHVQFGTLRDYFSAVRKSIAPTTSKQYFPSLAGDFFTYSDRDDNYWSGYYTSRPFHKHMDRVLEYNLRMAEILYSLTVAREAPVESDMNTHHMLTAARRALGLFQHHDGITGTAKDKVVDDYANKMLSALTKTKDVTQASLKALVVMEEPSKRDSLSSMVFNPEETYPKIKVLASHAEVDIKSRGKQIVSFVNSLAHNRVQLVSVVVNSADVMVHDSFNNAVTSQLNPVLLDGFKIAHDKFQLVFVATLPALGVAHYLITAGHEQVVRADVQYINLSPPSSSVFKTKQFPGNDFILNTSFNMSAKFSGNTGLLKAVSVGSSEVAMDLDFVSYSTRTGKEKSGAYLFLPDKDATTIVSLKYKPKIVTIAGPLLQEVCSDVGQVKHCMILSNSPGIDGRALTIHNKVDVSSESNKEIAMRFRSSIDNDDNTFYTDLNGFQLTRRRTYSKIPLQGNFYPMPTTAVLQDNNNRLTLYTRQPLGVGALKKGWLEVILDRRLMQDDSRGLGQGVKDSVLTLESFRLLIERRLSTTSSRAPLIYPSLLAQHNLDSLLHPPAAFISSAPASLPVASSYMQKQLPCDMFLVNLRSLLHQSESKSAESALVLHRRGFDCGFDMNPLICEVNNGSIKMGDIFKEVTISEATETSLSLLHDVTHLDLQSELVSRINVMQLKTYRLAW